MILIPKNLPLLINQHPNREANEALEKVLKGTITDTALIMAELGRYWKIRVWFDQPVKIHQQPRWHNNGDGSKTLVNSKTTDCHTFSYFWYKGVYGLCYRTTGGRRTFHGYPFEWMAHVTRYEPLPYSEPKDEFDSFEQFKARFDPFFITEEEIQKLWNEKSAQTGQHYHRSDFRSMGPVGKEVMERFLRFFKGIGTGSSDAPGYVSYVSYEGRYGILTAYHDSRGHGVAGRDITITHQTNRQRYCHYSSEYPGCGNGRYGLVANKTTFLHLEDD